MPEPSRPDRIAAIVAILGAGAGLDSIHVDLLCDSMPMRNVGEIGRLAMLVRKLGSLTDEERLEMQRHTVIGHEIFAGTENELSQMTASVALTHHERFDGSGYPHGLVGEDIPLEGRIAAVADVFDALLSVRSYRAALSIDDASAMMREGSGTQFDPLIVDLLLVHLAAGGRSRWQA